MAAEIRKGTDLTDAFAPATRTKAILALAAAAASLAFAAPASAQETSFSGETSDDVAVKLSVGEFGNATAFRVAGNDVECNRGTLSNRAVTFSRFDRSDPGSFNDNTQGSNRVGAIKFKTTTRIAGTAAADLLSWSGTYKVTTKVIEDGRKIDTCRVNATWDAD